MDPHADVLGRTSAALRSRRTQAVLVAALVLLLIGLTGLAPRLIPAVPDAGSLLLDPTAVAGVPAWAGAVSRLVNLL